MVCIETSQGIKFFISPEDEERVKKHTWCAVDCGSNWYIRRTIRIKGGGFMVQYLHRFIADCPDGMQVHHLNGDTLDNRRENLEVVTQQENLHYRYSGDGK